MKKRTDASLEELVAERLEKIAPASFVIKGLKEIAAFIRNALSRHFFIIGDYDVDGVMATGIMYKALTALGADVEFYIPHRFSDGYGANPKIIDLVPKGSVVILVDNGIVAYPAVEAAKAKGCDVIIIDHHLGAESGELPPADFIVDPNAIEGQCEFTAYCGAGLAYKLTAELGVDTDVVEECSALAAYATVADVVPLVGENWLIASNLDKAYLNVGLNALLKEMKVEGTPDSEDAGFKICPAINAPGRLIDDGATRSLKLILEGNAEAAAEKAKGLKEMNDARKMMVEISVNKAEKMLARDGFDKCIALITDIQPGIVGIVAGKLAEKYLVPTFIFSDMKDGTIKGSARTAGDNHLKNMLDQVSDLLLKYGGHAAAAGLSMAADNIGEFRKRIAEITVPVNAEDLQYYDCDVEPEDILNAIDVLDQAAPYGEGNPAFIFKTSLSVNEKRPCISMGKYLKIGTNENVDVMCFDNVPDTDTVNGNFDVYGPISVNIFKGKATPQIEARELCFNN